MPITSEDVPQAPGANGSMPFGDATKTAALQREVESRTGTGGPPQPQVAPQQPGAPQPPTAPQAQPSQPSPQDGRLDMNQVFPPMPEVQPQVPWRDSLRAAAFHPQAGPALAHLADMISKQHGPLR